MASSELVTTHHLTRKALIYIRQSTPHQMLTNQESLRLQYALEQRAIELGWRPDHIEIIDADLGVTGSSAHHRHGFQDLVAQTTLGHVGIILSFDVTRLARNCSDWYPLLDVCGYHHCLIADTDGIYDPSSTNGRLLLGLKGQLSEFELHTIRARMTAGLLNKAERGELALTLPVGLIRHPTGVVHFDPHQDVQERLQLLFTQFLRLKTASKVLQFFQAHQLQLPRRDRFGELTWKSPTIASILAILKNPAYAGAFVYGRTRTIHIDAHTCQTKRLPPEQWKICVKNIYPAYITWDCFEHIQALLADNYAEYDRNKSRGIPRPGAALLHGIVYCGACGHKMVVQYKGGTRYLCNYLRQQHHTPVCQNIAGDPIDAYVVDLFFQALTPRELAIYEQAMNQQEVVQEQLRQAHQTDLQRCEYEAALAERQYRQVDPENRLVAAELERRWESALQTLHQAQSSYETFQQQQLPKLQIPPEMRDRWMHMSERIPLLWQQGDVSAPHKKALLRCLIDKVVMHREAPGQIQVRVVWKGGDVTSTSLMVPLGTFQELAGAEEMEQFIVEHSQAGWSDEAMAQELTHLGFRSPMKTTVLSSTVKTIRLRHRILQVRSQSHPRHIPGMLTVSQLSQSLQVSPHWVYDRIHNGTIALTKDPVSHLFLFPDHPSTLTQFRQLIAGSLQQIRFSGGYQDV
jgi:DNA invertase Pin-like site-specific DNA recombinase